MANSKDRVAAWYRQHGAALLLFGIALTGDRGCAQDALHEVFLRLLSGRGVDQIADPRPYLFAALRNTIIKDSKRRDRDVPLEPSVEPWFEAPDGFLEELAIQRALIELPPDQRAVIVLHIWGGLTFAQAAEVLDISPNTAAARYRYGLTKLRTSLLAEKGEGLRVRSE